MALVRQVLNNIKMELFIYFMLIGLFFILGWLAITIVGGLIGFGLSVLGFICARFTMDKYAELYNKSNENI